ncbi:MAG: hypothetical protein Tsb0014_31480 [Pleurocapsa sp.]
MFNPVFDFSDRPVQADWQSVYRSLSSYIIPCNVPSTAIIAFAPDKRIVLIQPKDTKSWSLPGGEIFWGESIKKNVRRKLAVQTGLELVKIKHTAGLHYTADNSQARSFSIVVVIDVLGDIEIKDLLEVEEVRLFSLDNLPMAKPHTLNHELYQAISC